MTKETPNLTKLRELEARMLGYEDCLNALKKYHEIEADAVKEAERKIKTLYTTSGGLATAGLGMTKVLDDHNDALNAVADALEYIIQRFKEEDRAKTDLAETH